jgi:hypothetical protein
MIPSLKESVDAIALARKALDEHDGRFWFGNIEKLEEELYNLDLFTDSERSMAVDIALQEIAPTDRIGPNPPNDYSVHGPFANQRLYAFRWKSANFGKTMYLKFAFIVDAGPTKLAVYSLHEAAY